MAQSESIANLVNLLTLRCVRSPLAPELISGEAYERAYRLEQAQRQGMSAAASNTAEDAYHGPR